MENSFKRGYIAGALSGALVVGAPLAIREAVKEPVKTEQTATAKPGLIQTGEQVVTKILSIPQEYTICDIYNVDPLTGNRSASCHQAFIALSVDTSTQYGGSSSNYNYNNYSTYDYYNSYHPADPNKPVQKK